MSFQPGAAAGGKSYNTSIYARVVQNTPQSLTNGAVTAITMDTVMFSGGIVWDSGNATRIPVALAGIYQVNVGVLFAASGAGSYRQLWVHKNGSTAVRHAYNILCPVSSTQVLSVTGSSLMSLAAGDYLELIAVQDSGGALSTSTGSGFNNCGSLDLTLIELT